MKRGTDIDLYIVFNISAIDETSRFYKAKPVLEIRDDGEKYIYYMYIYIYKTEPMMFEEIVFKFESTNIFRELLLKSLAELINSIMNNAT
jgi:hypothetical protein